MLGSISAPENQLQRRDRFRAYMQAFNPAAPPRDVIEAGLVLEDLHQSLYRNLAARADLEPGSQQLLVGGVGSGKTTELLLAREWLREQGHVLPLYFDISKATDLAGLNTGSLVASFGLGLARHLSEDFDDYKRKSKLHDELGKAFEEVWSYAYGKNVTVWVSHDDSGPEPSADPWEDEEGHFTTRTVPGKLKPPLPSLHRDIQKIRGPLDEFLVAVRKTQRDIVVTFDGLDRLLDATKFWTVAQQDFRLLRQLKVSVLATAPLSVLFGAGVGQSISDQFDRVHHLAVIAADPHDSPLQSVLEKRGGSKMLDLEAMSDICRFSGGVLRDLISLARDSAEEAYVSDHDFVTIEDIQKVVLQLGEGYLRGLGPEAMKTLLKLEAFKSFQVNQPANVELLLTRRVLEYSATDFRVHPALLSVIPKPELKRA